MFSETTDTHLCFLLCRFGVYVFICETHVIEKCEGACVQLVFIKCPCYTLSLNVANLGVHEKNMMFMLIS